MQAAEATEELNSTTASSVSSTSDDELDASVTTDETEEVSLIKPYPNTEVDQELELNVKTTKRSFATGVMQNLAEVWKAPPVSCSIQSSLRIPGTVMAIGLVIVVAGICGSLLF